jgi:hypothetical protein
MSDQSTPTLTTNWADHGVFQIWTRDHGLTLGLRIETSDPEDFAKFREALDLAERVQRLRRPQLNIDAEWAE